MHPLFPGNHRVEEFHGSTGISEDIIVHPVPKGLGYQRVGHEIHVRDPHRQFRGSLFSEILQAAILDAPGTEPVDNLVKIPG